MDIHVIHCNLPKHRYREFFVEFCVRNSFQNSHWLAVGFWFYYFVNPEECPVFVFWSKYYSIRIKWFWFYLGRLLWPSGVIGIGFTLSCEVSFVWITSFWELSDSDVWITFTSVLAEFTSTLPAPTVRPTVAPVISIVFQLNFHLVSKL